eukprot:TRINITY_DN603_c0_g1_i2.p2 TRINITY_DN603_c0_g1~~TRINITY_DN603_c0_g1_i2.p2  ORF type:complete len:376 (+),score=113.98 TRINITY_DN603_c0_g1_i2:103-1230(+)
MEKVSVFGIGKLGICFALVLEKAGYDVLGIDVFPDYCDKVNKKTLKSSEPEVEKLLAASKNLRATTSFDEGIAFSDTYFLMVATPSSGGEKHYDHSVVNRLLSQFNARRLENKHIVIGCTIIPGYIRHVGRLLLRDCKNVTLSYNPEFIAQGQIVAGLWYPDMVLIGEGSEEAGEKLEAFYRRMTLNEPVIARMSPESAEITKLAVNCFITMKITYANQIGDIADKTPGADKDAILAAVGEDSRVGTKCLRAGYGFGGPCFPRDNRALGGYATTVGIDAQLMTATDDYNRYHAERMAEEFLKLEQEEYVFKDVTYKPACPVPLIEESQVLVVARILVEKGKKVIIRDRQSVIEEVMMEYGDMFEYDVVPDEEILG